MKIVLYCSAFNGLSQRAWLELGASGHDVSVHLASGNRTLERVCRAVELADFVVSGGRDEFEAVVLDRAQSLATGARSGKLLEQKRRRRAGDERLKPLEAYRTEELAEMSRDMFDNRSGFAQARQAFVHKQRPTATPAYLATG